MKKKYKDLKTLRPDSHRHHRLRKLLRQPPDFENDVAMETIRMIKRVYRTCMEENFFTVKRY